MHAYAILAHKNLDQLHRLVRTLDTGQASFFIHIDKKTDIVPYKQELDDLGRMPNVEFVRRYHSPWASIGVVRAQRAAMETALRATQRFTHLTLLTGQDYPIRPPHEIDAFFDAHRGTSFMEYGAKNRRNFRMHRYRFRNWWVYLAGRHWKVPLKKVGIRRSIPGGMKAFRGWAFFTLSRNCTRYAVRFLDANPRYFRFFKHTLFADEFFWHTLLLNSPLRETVANKTLRYEPYEGGTGHGRILRQEDLAELQILSSERFFAKKFDSTVDPDILDIIDRDLLEVVNT
jgi:hypothetical protein